MLVLSCRSIGRYELVPKSLSSSFRLSEWAISFFIPHSSGRWKWLWLVRVCGEWRDRFFILPALFLILPPSGDTLDRPLRLSPFTFFNIDVILVFLLLPIIVIYAIRKCCRHRWFRTCTCLFTIWIKQFYLEKLFKNISLMLCYTPHLYTAFIARFPGSLSGNWLNKSRKPHDNVLISLYSSSEWFIPSPRPLLSLFL